MQHIVSINKPEGFVHGGIIKLFWSQSNQYWVRIFCTYT